MATVPMTTHAAERPLFDAVLHPHRSLGPTALRLIVGLVAVASAIAAIPFLALGLWPVAGFYGLDVLLLYLALRASLAQARAYEQVVVSPLELLLRKVSAAGLAREWRFNPVWTRLDRDIHAEFGVQRLAIVSRGEAVPVAAFLSPEEKAGFGDALGRALAEARRGVRYDGGGQTKGAQS